MLHRRLGNSDLKVSEIGFGCMSLTHDEEASTRILHEALAGGINFFDTADLYQSGQNEVWLGKALGRKRQDMVIATKVGNRWRTDESGWDWDPSKEHIHAAVKQSLQRLRTDYIDVYQLHGGTLEDNIDETIEAFEELVDAGYIRYYGISSIRPNVIRKYVEKSRIVSVMMQYSILDRRPEEEMLDFLQEQNISVIARGPIAKGLLSQRTLSEPTVDEFLDYSTEDVKQLVTGLAALPNHNRSISQIALRYALAHPAVATVIPGASSIAQLQENCEAANVQLSAEEVAGIQAASHANRYQLHR